MSSTQQELSHARRYAGYVGIGAAVIMIYAAAAHYPAGDQAAPGAAVFPILVGAGLLIASLMVLFESFGKERNPARSPFTLEQSKSAAVTVTLFAGYILALPIAGYFLATLLFATATLRVLTHKTLTWSAAASLAATVVLDTVFFGIPLPSFSLMR